VRVYIKLVKDYGVRVVNFVAAKNLIAKSTISTHRNICKCNSPGRKAQSDLSDLDRLTKAFNFDIRSFIEVECNTDQCLVADGCES
jgi:hypothetical protein